MTPLSHIPVGPVELAYLESNADAPGRPFVLVHGFTGSTDDFVDVHPALAAHGRTISLDQRGHGDSSNTGERASYTLEQLSSDLLGFLDALRIERCDLLGHSMGGMVVLRFALAHPERVASLVLMDTAPHPLDLMPLGMMQAGAKLGHEQGMAALYEVMRSAPSEGRPPAMLRCEQEMGVERYQARIRAKIEAMDPEAMHALAGELAGHTPVSGRLAEIACPTLVIVGEQDAPFLEPSRSMAEGIANARLSVVPDAAHSPQLENPAAWLAAVQSHLRTARAAEPAG